MFSVDDPKTTQCCSLFADPSIDQKISLLDDESTTVTQAVTKARTTFLPVFISFGFVREPLGLAAWNGVGSDSRKGWGVLFGPDMRWKYIGEIKDGRPHGDGTKFSGDLSSPLRYEGRFFQGKRDGWGRVIDREEVVEQGIYVDDTLEPQGRIVTVTVIKNGQPVDMASFALLCAPAIDHFTATTPDYGSYATALQDLIPAQINKIGKAFGWEPFQRHRIRNMYIRYAVSS
jgi:hypothetical protein